MSPLIFVLALLLLALAQSARSVFAGGGAKAVLEPPDQNGFTDAEWAQIFPKRNRNAGGAQFFHWILANAETPERFWLLNRSYCAVSGSLVDPKSDPHVVHVRQQADESRRKSGLLWKCCWPCVCDIEEFATTEPFYVERLEITVDVLTISDPCDRLAAFPQEVTSWSCTNHVKASSGRAIVGVLHPLEGRESVSQSSNQALCAERRASYPSPQGGMGDIFVRLAVAEPAAGGLKNVYGDPLKPCRRIDDDDRGSWDDTGRCSEMGGGVHQICMRMPADFSSQTGQSGWSRSRAHTTHCACLGAWALYVAKGSEAELDCEAIPEDALSTRYIEKWSVWNGHELPNQIESGVDELARQCVQKQPDETKRRHLLARVSEIKEHFRS